MARLSDVLALPGLIDCHVHFREPGLTHKEDFESGMRAALAGGVTTVCDMPNTEPPTCTVQALQDKIKRVERLGNSKFDIRFFFGITKQEHLRELENVMKRDDIKKYVPGVKLYFGQSTGEQMIDPSVVQDVFKLCTELDLPVVCHCEDEAIIQRNLSSFSSSKRSASRSLSTRLAASLEENNVAPHSEIRSIEAATKAVTQAIEFARRFGTRLHIAHLSSADELQLVRAAKKSGLQVTCEVAPHHLFLNVEDYKTLGTLAKVNPPLRTKEHSSALFEGILDGSIDCVASDHAPHTLEEKKVGHPLDAPSGIPGVETLLPLLLSCVFGNGPVDAQGNPRLLTTNYPSERLGRAGKLQISDIVRLLFENPNHIFRLGRSKERDSLITIDPSASWVIRGKDLHSKCGWTPYEGWTVQGKVLY